MHFHVDPYPKDPYQPVKMGRNRTPALLQPHWQGDITKIFCDESLQYNIIKSNEKQCLDIRMKFKCRKTSLNGFFIFSSIFLTALSLSGVSASMSYRKNNFNSIVNSYLEKIFSLQSSSLIWTLDDDTCWQWYHL